MPPATAFEYYQEDYSGPSKRGGSCTRPPYAAAGAAPKGPNETKSVEYLHSTSIQSVNLVLDAAGFNFLGGQGCAKMRVRSSLGLVP